MNVFSSLINLTLWDSRLNLWHKCFRGICTVNLFSYLKTISYLMNSKDICKHIKYTLEQTQKQKDTCPFAPLTASSASWQVSYVTNPNPLLRFVSRSFTIFTSNKNEIYLQTLVWQQIGQVEKPCFGHGRESERCYRNF